MADVKALASPSTNLDEIKRRYPPDISDEDFNRMIEADREGRAAWTVKQASRGKEE